MSQRRSDPLESLFDPPAAPSARGTRVPGAIGRLLEDAGRDARRQATVAAVVLALATLGAVPRSATVEEPSVVVGAGELVRVDQSTGGPSGATGATGAYLLPRVRVVTTTKAWLAAVLPGGARAGPGEAQARAGGATLLDDAVLTGRGMAPGRTTPAALGVEVRLLADGLASDQLAVLLHVADRVHSGDLAGGRRILALGSVTASGTVRCSADPLTTLRATSPAPDLVVTAAGCGPYLGWTGGIRLVEVGTFAEAFAAIGRPAEAP